LRLRYNKTIDFQDGYVYHVSEQIGYLPKDAAKEKE